MAQVSITVNANTYNVSCADGEEQHIKDLAQVLDSKVAELVGAIGQAGESRLLAMAGLLMADDLAEAKNQPARALEPAPASSINEEHLIQRLETLAAHIESIAQRVEGA
ncbi:MAG: cell division protein ZapA [Rhodospirillaceae bacterium]|nr:MAG: cell division protein ZapA [Rhodospirillaceae bacterium]